MQVIQGAAITSPLWEGRRACFAKRDRRDGVMRTLTPTPRHKAYVPLALLRDPPHRGEVEFSRRHARFRVWPLSSKFASLTPQDEGRKQSGKRAASGSLVLEFICDPRAARPVSVATVDRSHAYPFPGGKLTRG